MNKGEWQTIISVVSFWVGEKEIDYIKVIRCKCLKEVERGPKKGNECIFQEVETHIFRA